jgi:excisionase family DNA binding protein
MSEVQWQSDGSDGCLSVSVSQAGKSLGVCTRTVRREIDRGRLAAFRVGRSLRIRMTELRRYMERQEVRV